MPKAAKRDNREKRKTAVSEVRLGATMSFSMGGGGGVGGGGGGGGGSSSRVGWAWCSGSRGGMTFSLGSFSIPLVGFDGRKGR